MSIQDQIEKYIASQPGPKRSDLQVLHSMILHVRPTCRVWFFDGRNSENKIVSNPNIGYGFHTLHYTNGETREWFQIGLSANTTGISVYILGIADKTYLAKTYKKKLGKASVTGYCIKFKTLKDIDINILEAAIRYGFENTSLALKPGATNQKPKALKKVKPTPKKTVAKKVAPKKKVKKK